MKRWLLIASCLTLGLPALADAQPDQNRPDQGQNRPGLGGGARPDQARPNRPGAGSPGQGGPNQGRPGSSRPGPGRPDQGGPVYGGPNRPGRPEQGRPNRPGHGGPNRPGTPNRPGILPIRPTNPPRPQRPRWGWNGHRFRGRAFHYPAGWRYRRWTHGQFLPLLFLSPIYYFNDWAFLGIQPPPPGYRWVRFGPDLLLVQIGTGYIAYVIHNAVY